MARFGFGTCQLGATWQFFPPTHTCPKHQRATDEQIEKENALAQSRTLDQQIEQIERMAAQHFPEDAHKRSAYTVSLLVQRLREYHAKTQALEEELGTAVDFIQLKVKEQ
jgi:hypothetical protein